MSFQKKCGPCEGNGYYSYDRHDLCQICHGTGRLLIDGEEGRYVLCRVCESHGYVGYDHKDTCAVCHGLGLVTPTVWPHRQSQPQPQSIPAINSPSLPVGVKGVGFRAFIVHGHDGHLLLDLKNYLQNTLRWPEPIILFQKASSGRTVIEKFEHYASDVDIAFVLLTPDDIGGQISGEQRSRARQNVVFELGYFVRQFGRRSGRVFLLHKDNIEMPSDLAGVVYLDVTHGIEAAGEAIRREITAIDGAV